MNLFEYEGKQFLKDLGIQIPHGICVQNLDKIEEVINFPVFVKAQVMSSGRGKMGLVRRAENVEQLKAHAHSLLGSKFFRSNIKTLLIEEALSVVKEYFLTVSYDTLRKNPVIIFGDGGMEIESNKNLIKLELDPLDFLNSCEDAVKKISNLVEEKQKEELVKIIKAVLTAFWKLDLRQLEINPLIYTSSGHFVAADAKISFDDSALARQKNWSDFFANNSASREETEREKLAKEIDIGQFSYRGTASNYLELDGDIGVLFSGGGASITNMDTLFALGGNPANYAEYSGNPSRVKVAALTRIVLGKPGLKGLWIAGGVANFTRIDETLAGVCDALREIRPSYPIVCRRAGPGVEVGKKIMEDTAKELGLNLHFFGDEMSMTESARILMKLIYGHTS